MSTLKTDNITPNGSILTVTGGLTLSGAAYFSGGSTFSSSLTVGSTITTAGLTSSAVLSCATAPTQGQHLVNKTYTDSVSIPGLTGTRTVTNSVVPLYSYISQGCTSPLPSGTWFVNFSCASATNSVPQWQHAKIWTVPSGQYLRFYPQCTVFPDGVQPGGTMTAATIPGYTLGTSTVQTDTSNFIGITFERVANVQNLSAGLHNGMIKRGTDYAAASVGTNETLFGYAIRMY